MRTSGGGERGFTLVEVSILLSVLVILSAVMAPVLGGSIANARITAARTDLETIARAVQSFLTDIACDFVPQNRGSDSGRYARDVVVAPTLAAPITAPVGESRDGVALRSDLRTKSGCSGAALCTGDPVEILVSAGDIPSLGPEGAEEWVERVDGLWVDFLEYYLISNTPGGDTQRSYPTVAECLAFLGDRFATVSAWRGAYISVGGGDPWGNRYAINTALLARDQGEDVVVLSAGPDMEIDSEFFLDGFVPGDDDLAVLISPGR